MATEIHRHGQARNVRGINLDVHTERGDAAAETLRTDAEFVDTFEQLDFKLPDVSARIANVEWPQHGLFRQQCGALECATDAHTDDDRRTCVGTCAIDGIEYELRNRGDAVGGHKHLQRAHVLCAEAL